MAYLFGRVSRSWHDRFSSKFEKRFFATSCGPRALPRKAGAPRRPDDAEIPRVLFDPLEHRYLLSADISPLTIAMLDAGHDLIVHFDGSPLEVTNDATEQVIGEQAADRTSRMQTNGSGQDEQLTIAQCPVRTGFGIKFDGATCAFDCVREDQCSPC